MKRIVITLFLVAIALLLAIAGTDVKRWSEINRATGAMRTRSTHAFVFSKPWTESPTWISERAKDLGIGTDTEWMPLDRYHRNLLVISHSSARAPASYLVFCTDESGLTKVQQDTFVRTFVASSEDERDRMIRELIDGNHPPP